MRGHRAKTDLTIEGNMDTNQDLIIGHQPDMVIAGHPQQEIENRDITDPVDLVPIMGVKEQEI